MLTEIILAMSENLKGVAFGFFVTLVFVCLFSPLLALELEFEMWDFFKILYKKVKYFAIFFLIILVLPSPSQLWHVRIDLIKFHLASPENIARGADVIERLGHKLECKYLGCEEEKK